MTTKSKTFVFVAILVALIAAMFSLQSVAIAEPTFRYAGGGDCYAAWTADHTYSQDQNTDHCVTSDSIKFIGSMRFQGSRPYDAGGHIDVPATSIVIIHKDDGTTVVVIVDDGGDTDDGGDDDTAKTCKNKNSSQDGTTEECNAGGGQEKHKNK